uniref:Uncharacterized protein n=1 Tax=Anguilla anguilla TaxID=7936 RepID=A0A0E9R142_ANGAN
MTRPSCSGLNPTVLSIISANTIAGNHTMLLSL